MVQVKETKEQTAKPRSFGKHKIAVTAILCFKLQAQTAPLVVIVQYPLRHAAHSDDSPHSFRQAMRAAGFFQPAIQSLPPQTDRFSQMAALLADESPQARQQADLAEAIAQLMVFLLQ